MIRAHSSNLNVRVALSLLAALLLTAATGRSAAGGEKVVLGKRYPREQLLSINAIDHATWDSLLRRYVDADGFVNYAGWKRSQGDVGALDAYLQTLSQADPRKPASREATLAFWINAYNAVTIRGILREYPTTSIRNHTAKVWGYNIWDDLLLTVGNENYSLNQMEHDLLRHMGEKRIHFAIVCASVGCPRLRAEAYTPQRLEQQLAENTTEFFKQPRNFRIDAARNTVYVSSILKWFSEDFGDTPQAGLRSLLSYVSDASAKRLIEQGRFRVSYLSYDWSLNDQARRKVASR